MGSLRLGELIREARRRRVFRVAGVYIVGGFAVLQAADLALPALDLVTESIRYVWIAVILGFPIALVLGWLYDIDDGRIIRVTRTEQDADLSLHRIDYLILSALAVLGLGMLLGLASELTDNSSEISRSQVSGAFSNSSIAVLPFDDTSIDREASAAIALGLQDSLLTSLSKINDLKVISRTSVERYRDSDLTVPEIGTELGVATILEGSVQVNEGKLRVNAQLIDTATDEHLWADVYDRDLTTSDMFAIQSEIVRTVVSQINKELSQPDDHDGTRPPTSNLDAYRAYLKGKREFERYATGSNESAIQQFEAAIAWDSEFALAYVGLAGALLESGDEFAVELAEIRLNRSFELDSEMGEAYIVLGTMNHLRGNFLAAEDAFNAGITLEPGNSQAYRYLGRLRWDQGRLVEALSLLQQAIDLNPNSAGINYELGRLYDLFGRFDEALDAYKRSLRLEPDRYYVETYIAALYYLARGQVDESVYWYHRGAATKHLPSGGEAAAGIAYLDLGDPDSASKFIERGRALNPTGFWPLFVSLLHSAYIQDPERVRSDAVALLEAIPTATAGLRYLRNQDLAEGRFEAARRRYARAYPGLESGELPVDRSNYKAGVDLARVMQHLGEDDVAERLLKDSLQTLIELPRMGVDGYWVADAQIYALLGETSLALNSLADAIASGWRAKTWYHFDQNPNFDSIRDSEEFQRMRRLVENDLLQQAQHVDELKASGDIMPLEQLSHGQVN